MSRRSTAPDPFLLYLFPVFAAVSLTAAVDALLIVPLVEIDPALGMRFAGGPALQAIRSIAPTLVPVLIGISLVTAYTWRVRQALRREPTGSIARARVLRAPRVLALSVTCAWVGAFIVGGGMDLVLASFETAGEAAAYYATSALAMISTGLFGFFVTYLIVEVVNRRRMIPYAFPDGFVSRDGSVPPVTITQTFVALWFASSFFPMLVLGLGLYTSRYLPQNETLAFMFIAVFVPASFVLVLRVGRTLHEPIRRLVGVTGDIAAGSYDTKVTSTENDDIGYLTDATVEMARALGETDMIKETFGRAVDPRVRDHLLSGSIALAGERRVAAIMFCDIRGFTTYSEGRSEEAVLSVLNEHLTEMDRVVQAHGGMVNKFLGDGFLALFGVPLASPDPAGEALRCAAALVAANTALNATRKNRGDEAFAIGVGLHLGSVVAGNVGSPHRSEYTVIGDAVNLTSRLEGLTKDFDVPIVATRELTEGVHSTPDTIRVTDLGTVQVRGRSAPVALVGCTPLAAS